MAEPKLGDWLWYVGASEADDEMMQSGSREQAIRDGQQNYHLGQRFYIVEARMRCSDERALESGRIDTAPFAETRNGEWISNRIAVVEEK